MIKSKIFLRKTFLLFIFIPLTLSFLTACSTPKERRFEKDGAAIAYRKQTDMGSLVQGKTFGHPITISQQQVEKHLASIRYETLTMFGKVNSVFTKEGINKLTVLLTKALNKVTPIYAVYFEVAMEDGLSAGEVFFTNGKLNWRISQVFDVDFVAKLKGGKSKPWRLVPQAGQAYYTTSEMLGKSKKTNWLVVELDSDSAPAKSATGAVVNPEKKSNNPPKPDKASSKNELEEKLKFLKSLREKNLIDDEEYKIKRKDLLDKYL